MITKYSLGTGAGSRTKPCSILVRSSWQTINIGDIGHTPGLLALLERLLPDAEVTLWPNRIAGGVEEMLRQRFPGLKIATTDEEIRVAIQDNDFLLHGSGPYLVAARDVERWLETGKPYGVFGITLMAETFDARVRKCLDHAEFVYFRDSVSLDFARTLGLQCPVLEFVPDAAFAADVADDEKAKAFLSQHALEPGKFLCCIGRYRITPHWKIPELNAPYHADKDAHNQRLLAQDHPPLRDAITAIVSSTDLKILLCPEDKTQMALAKETLWDPLPAAIKERVVWREQYWLTDEALSTYRLSAGLFGHEMHSPIMCIGQGIPAVVVRWAEQTSKGFMWRDIGLGDWLYDFDQEKDRVRFPAEMLQWAQNLPLAKNRARTAQALVTRLHEESFAQLVTALLSLKVENE